MPKTAILIFIACCWTLVASASASDEVTQIPLKGPYVHKPSGITFPETLGKLRIIGLTDYGNSKLGISIRYQPKQPLIWGDLFLYTKGLEPLRDDPSNQLAIKELQQAMGDLNAARDLGFYTDLKLGHVASTIIYGQDTAHPFSLLEVGCSFRDLRVEQALTDGAPEPLSSFLATGVAHNHFVKIRYTCATRFDPEEMEETRKEFIDAFARVILDAYP